MTYVHNPVMVSEALTLLDTPQCRRVIDGTLGWGGHTEAFLNHHPEVEVLGIDRDSAAVEAASERLKPFAGRVRIERGAYADMAVIARSAGWDRVDGILLDIGVSSPQIDDARRGFSYRQDGPLDMRMDRRQSTTAAVILNSRSEDELARLFYEYGEEPQARRIARAVVERRMEKPWSYTQEFAELLESMARTRGRGRDVPPAMRCFQALRMAVNGELDQLKAGLEAAMELLTVGGRLAVISFHSLEDRLVKQFFRFEALDCVCPPDIPTCMCTKTARLRVLTRKPIRPTDAEIAANRRAAPARLRAAERLPEQLKTGKRGVVS